MSNEPEQLAFKALESRVERLETIDRIRAHHQTRLSRLFKLSVAWVLLCIVLAGAVWVAIQVHFLLDENQIFREHIDKGKNESQLLLEHVRKERADKVKD